MTARAMKSKVTIPTMTSLDPNDFVDTEEAFGDDYDPDDGITLASFTIVPGDAVDHTTLVYSARGIEGGYENWGIKMYYGYRYNGPDIPIADAEAERILENLASGTIEDEDWAAQDGTYFE